MNFGQFIFHTIWFAGTTAAIFILSIWGKELPQGACIPLGIFCLAGGVGWLITFLIHIVKGLEDGGNFVKD